MAKKEKLVNKFAALQTLAEGIEVEASEINDRQVVLFKPMFKVVKKLLKAGALGIDIVNSLKKFPACTSTVRGWINDLKADEDKNPKHKGQPSKASKTKGAGKKAAAEGKAEGFTRSRILKNVVLATVAKAIGEQITDETTVAEAVVIAKATCNALGRPKHKSFADELASVGEQPKTETETEPTPEDVADIIDNAEADAEPDAVDVRDAVPELV